MGNLLKDKRIKAGLTQDELSKKSDVSRAIINGLESGRIDTTTTKTLRKIAEALNSTVSDIFFAEDV